jgi:hypothetical protein
MASTIQFITYVGLITLAVWVLGKVCSAHIDWGYFDSFSQMVNYGIESWIYDMQHRDDEN